MIARLNRNVEEALHDPSVDTEVKQWALDRIDAIGPKIDRFIDDETRKQYVTSYLKIEKARYQAATSADLPDWLEADEARDEPLCTCGNPDCDIKKGRIPVSIDEKNLLEGIRRFKQEHPGYPQALDAAGDAFLDDRAAIQRTLRRVYASLGSNEVIEPGARS